MVDGDRPGIGESELVLVGKISSSFGVRGWVKVHSFTDPVDNVLEYLPWFLQQNGKLAEIKVLSGRPHGKGIVAQLDNIEDRDQSDLLRGSEIYVDRAHFPARSDDEHYWVDLVGMAVENLEGQALGTIESLLATGANDVMVVQSGQHERLIPFVLDHYVKSIDYETRSIKVDWDSDF